MKHNLVQFASYLTKEQYTKLVALRNKTRVPMSDYIREGVDMIIKKYLNGKKK